MSVTNFLSNSYLSYKPKGEIRNNAHFTPKGLKSIMSDLPHNMLSPPWQGSVAAAWYVKQGLAVKTFWQALEIICLDQA